MYFLIYFVKYYLVKFYSLLGLIKDSTKKLLTNSDVETEIAEWLRRANTRVQRGKQIITAA